MDPRAMAAAGSAAAVWAARACLTLAKAVPTWALRSGVHSSELPASEQPLLAVLACWWAAQ